jgi:lysozyme
MRKISPEGRDLIKRWEGLRLEAYRCPAGVWTVGYGHTRTARQGMTITVADAERLLDGDLAEFARAVETALTRPATDGQFAAFVSLAFNIGIGAFRSSTALRRFNANDLAGAAEALTWWNKATVGGQKVRLAGLVNRREDERRLFWSDVSTDAGTLPVEQPVSAVEGGETKPLAKSKTLWGVLAAAAVAAVEQFGAVWGVVPDEVKAALPWLMFAVFAFLVANRVNEHLRGEH